MYAVAWFKPDEREGAIFPNVFPDFDMAQDTVLHQIKSDYGDVLDHLEFDVEIGGRYVIYYEQTVYLIGKLFNFNPRGL